MGDRIEYDDDGYLDEVVAGSAHLERMDGAKGGTSWFLNMTRADGTSVAIWFTGRVALIEERP